jgi:hypothetical protein
VAASLRHRRSRRPMTLIAKLCLFHRAFLQPDASRERRESYQVFMLIPGHSGIRKSHHRPRLKLRQQPACGPVGMAVRVAVICSAAKPAVRVGQTGRGRPRRVFQASQLILRLLTNSLAPMGAAISSAPSAEMLNCCARSLSLPLVTLKIIAAIHWEALRLWLKGTRWCHVAMPHPRTRLSIPAWRLATATTILDLRFLPAEERSGPVRVETRSSLRPNLDTEPYRLMDLPCRT